MRHVTNPAARMRARQRAQAGFTMIELMLVILIISILMAIAAPIYTKSVIHAKESVLKQDLFTLREQIDNYTHELERNLGTGNRGCSDEHRPDRYRHHRRTQRLKSDCQRWFGLQQLVITPR